MYRLICCALFGTLLFVPLVAAQNTPQEDPADLLRGWYRQFLDRGVDSAGWGYLNEMRRGKSPAAVASEILGSREYYQRAGSNPKAFIRTLFLDLAGREPTPQELQEWAGRVRADNRKELASAVMERFPKGWRHPTDPGEREYLAAVREVVDRLSSEVQRLQEDVVVELGPRKERDLYQRADATLQDLRHFQRSLRGGFDRKHVYDDFHRMDEKLHELMEATRTLGRDHPTLLRSVNRIQQADHQLHYALSQGDKSDERGKQVLARQVQALAAEAQELQRTARYALAQGKEGARLEKHVALFADAAAHFAKSLQQGAGRDHLQRDFAEVDKAWVRVAEDINQLPPLEGNYYLRTRAQTVDAVFDQVYHHLGMKGDRTRIVIPLAVSALPPAKPNKKSPNSLVQHWPSSHPWS